MKNYNSMPVLVGLFLMTCLSCSSKEEKITLAYKESNKWGLIGLDGEVVIPADFDNKITSIVGGFSVETSEDGFYFLDPEGKQSKSKYKEVTRFSNGNSVVVLPNSRPTVIDEDFDELFQVKAEKVFGFKNGYARIQENEKFGYINKKGQVTIEPSYTLAGNFDERGRAIVKVENHFRIIDDKGKELFKIPSDVKKVKQFSDRLMAFYTDGWGFLDSDGKTIIKPRKEWDDVTIFYNGYSSYKEDGLWGLIDKEGTKVIRAKFEWPLIFENDLAIGVVKGEDKKYRYGFVNMDADFVIAPDYDFALPFVEEYTLIKEGKYFYAIDRDGKQVNNLEYTEVDLSWLDSYFLKYGIDSNSILKDRGSSENVVFYPTNYVTNDYFDLKRNVDTLLSFINLTASSVYGIEFGKTPKQITQKSGEFKMPSKPGWNRSSTNVIIGQEHRLSMDIITNPILNFEKSVYHRPYEAHQDFRGRTQVRRGMYTYVENNLIESIEFSCMLYGKGTGKEEVMFEFLEAKLDSLFSRSDDNRGWKASDSYSILIDYSIHEPNSFSIVVSPDQTLHRKVPANLDISGTYVGVDEQNRRQFTFDFLKGVGGYDVKWRITDVGQDNGRWEFFKLKPTGKSNIFSVEGDLTGFGEGELNNPLSFEVIESSEGRVIMKTPIYWVKTIVKVNPNVKKNSNPNPEEINLDLSVETVKIGNQTWMKNNLGIRRLLSANVGELDNGKRIYIATSYGLFYKFFREMQPGVCFLDYDASNLESGIVYFNRHAILSEENPCPDGFHIPSKLEFNELIKFLKTQGKDALALKSKAGWRVPGTNEYGFNLKNYGGYSKASFKKGGTVLASSSIDGEYVDIVTFFDKGKSDESYKKIKMEGALLNDEGICIRCIAD